MQIYVPNQAPIIYADTEIQSDSDTALIYNSPDKNIHTDQLAATIGFFLVTEICQSDQKISVRIPREKINSILNINNHQDFQ